MPQTPDLQEVLHDLQLGLEKEHRRDQLETQLQAVRNFEGKPRIDFNVLQKPGVPPEARLERLRMIEHFAINTRHLLPEAVGSSIDALTEFARSFMTEEGVQKGRDQSTLDRIQFHWQLLRGYKDLVRRRLGLLDRIGVGDPRDPHAQSRSGVTRFPTMPGNQEQPKSEVQGESSRRNHFRRAGRGWSVCFEGKLVMLPDSRGVQLIACLLSRPFKGMTPSELESCISPAPSSKLNMDENPELCTVQDLGNSGSMSDKQTERDLQKRLHDLQGEREDAEGRNDLASIAKCNKEIAEIERYLSETIGLSGRQRKLDDHAERARKRVSNAITRALKIVNEHHADLWRHLKSSIRRGGVFVYEPKSDTPWGLG